MKVYQTLAVAIFAFMTMQCQAATTPASPVKIKNRTIMGTGTYKEIDRSVLRSLKFFDISTIANETEKTFLINRLFKSKGGEAIVFTYALLKKIASETNKNTEQEDKDEVNKTRANVLLSALEKDSNLVASLLANPDAVIKLTAPINKLKTNFTLTSAEIELIKTQLAAAPLAINTSGLGSPQKSTSTASPSPAASPRPAVLSIDFTGVWNSAKASKGAVYNQDFYRDYFLGSARELYKTDRKVFSETGGYKNWLNMTLTPVLIDAIFGAGTITDDFPWLKEQNPTLQVIGYLSWLLENLNDATPEKRVEKAVSKDLIDILKGDDDVSGPAKLSKQRSIISKDAAKSEQEETKAIGSAIVKIADWMNNKLEKIEQKKIFEYFKIKYGVDASDTPASVHRLILAFASSLAYMNPKDTLFNLSACTELRSSIKEEKLRSHIPETFCASLDGKYLIR